MRYYTTYDSPIGQLTLTSNGKRLTGLWMEGESGGEGVLRTHIRADLPVFDQTVAWLNAYFAAAPLPELPPLAMEGTAFRRAVWQLLLEIPYGATTTYGALAQRIAQQRGSRMSAQAVGGAVGHNPISILVPCHRVIGADGSLTGYAGGLERKIWLLAHEKNVSRHQ